MLAGVRRPGPDSPDGPDARADPLQPVRARLHLVRGGVQGMPHELGEVLSLRRHAVVAGSSHYSCSRAARSALMPRAV
jgi:hypothetical protein